MKKFLASAIITAAFALGLTACAPVAFPNQGVYGSGSYSPQLGYGQAMNGYNPGLAMAGPAGAVAARLGAVGMGGGFMAPPGGAGQSIYANTAYDPATHPGIIAQNPPTYIVGGGGAVGGVVMAPSGTVVAPTSQAAASQRDVRDLRDGVRVLMQQQVVQAGRLDRLERRR